MEPKFNVPVEDMLEDARTTQALFVEDKAAFIAKDTDFSDPFAQDWMDNSIETSEGWETAETRQDQQQQETGSKSLSF